MVPIGVAKDIAAGRVLVPRSAYPASDVRVLQVLQRFELGLPSARAIAVRARLSPTTVTAALRRLAARGVVTDEVVRTRAGLVRRIRTDCRSWPASVRSAVSQVVVPPLTSPVRALPRGLLHLVVGARSEEALAAALLKSPDPLAWAWALSNIPADVLRQQTKRRGAHPEARLMVHRALTVAGSSLSPEAVELRPQ